MYDTILIPTDGSEPATRSAEHAFELADQHGARVHLLYVVEVPAQGLAGAYGDAGTFDQEVVPALEEQGTSALDDLAERARAFGLDVTTDIRHGRPPEEILTYTDEHEIALIVMGTHGRSGVKRVLVGSTTERVLRTSDVPVLVVRADE